MSNINPSLGRIVLYQDHNGGVYPAIITGIASNYNANYGYETFNLELTIFKIGEFDYASDVKTGDFPTQPGKNPGRWIFPPRVGPGV